MRKYLASLLLLTGIVVLPGCKKESTTMQVPFDHEFSQPYTTGIIKMQYRVLTFVSGITTVKDTTVIFTSIGNNPSERDHYGFSKPSAKLVQLLRLNPLDFQNNTFISFAETDLNSLTLPYTFRRDQRQYAFINYTIQLVPFIDANGNLVNGSNTYAASTYAENFQLTILSRVNNRLQGTFSGLVRNQDGHVLQIDKGLFDIQIVER
jgi:hypothetical protein